MTRGNQEKLESEESSRARQHLLSSEGQKIVSHEEGMGIGQVHDPL